MPLPGADAGERVEAACEASQRRCERARRRVRGLVADKRDGDLGRRNWPRRFTVTTSDLAAEDVETDPERAQVAVAVLFTHRVGLKVPDVGNLFERRMPALALRIGKAMWGEQVSKRLPRFIGWHPAPFDRLGEVAAERGSHPRVEQPEQVQPLANDQPPGCRADMLVTAQG